MLKEPEEFKSLPEEFQTLKVLNAAIEELVSRFKQTSPGSPIIDRRHAAFSTLEISPELYLEFITQDYKILRDTPDELKTYQMCLNAVLQNGHAIKDTPHEFKTQELCNIVATKELVLIFDIPKKFINLELAYLVLTKKPSNIKYLIDIINQKKLITLFKQKPEILENIQQLIDSGSHKYKKYKEQITFIGNVIEELGIAEDKIKTVLNELETEKPPTI